MKAKNDFILQEIADEAILIPIGAEADRVHGIVKLNSTGVFLWKLLLQESQSKHSLKNSLVNAFSVTEEKAENDIANFLTQLQTIGCIED